MSTSHCPALFPSLFRICDRGVGIRTGVCLRDGKVCGRLLRYRGLSPLNSPNGAGGGQSTTTDWVQFPLGSALTQTPPSHHHLPYIWADCSDIYRHSVTMVIQAGENRGYSDASSSWSVTLYEAGPVILCCFYFICLTPAGLEVRQNVNCWGCSTLLLYWGIMSRT